MKKKDLKKFINFFEFTSKMNIKFAIDQSKIMFEEYLENNELKEISDRDIAS